MEILTNLKNSEITPCFFTKTQEHLLQALNACDGDMELLLNRMMVLATNGRDLKALQYAQSYLSANPRRS